MSPRRFWIDLENAPDVLFFEPIAAELRARGHEVLTTTRPYSSVPELAELYGIGGEAIGRHGGPSGWRKLGFGLLRTAGLVRWARGRGFDFAVGFGSRPLALGSGLLRLPNATVFDYEHVSLSALNRFCQWIFVPSEVSVDYLAARGVARSKLVRYSGLKEEVYTGIHRPTEDLRARLGVEDGEILLVIRPPAVSAHYHDPEGELACTAILERAVAADEVVCLLLSRDGEALYDHFLRHQNVRSLPIPVRGLDLVAVADVVVSGGGTMVREAAALGVPSYSIFTGRPGAVDARLAAEGRLSLIRGVADVDGIELARRPEPSNPHESDTTIRDFFVDELIRMAGERR